MKRTKKAKFGRAILMTAAPPLTFMFMAAAMQEMPGLCSSPADDYLRANNYPDSVAQNYDISRMHVYQRNNPLYALHQAGRPFASFSDNPQPTGRKLVQLPFAMLGVGVKAGVELFRSDVSDNAFADPNNSETCFIRPPKEDFDLAAAVAHSSAIFEIASMDNFVTDAPQEEIRQALRTVIMAHEMRHCEQPRHEYVAIKESDADLKAIEVLRQSGYDEAVVKETYQLMVASRVLSTLVSDMSHDTSTSIFNGQAGFYDVVRTGTAHRGVGLLVGDVVANHRFPQDMPYAERRYHAVEALLYDGALRPFGPDAVAYAELYLKAYQRINKFADNTLITDADYAPKIDLEFLRRNTGLDINKSLQELGPAL